MTDAQAEADRKSDTSKRWVCCGNALRASKQLASDRGARQTRSLRPVDCKLAMKRWPVRLLKESPQIATVIGRLAA
eukprot:CAMPEP_0206430856 /NCGR_PEP_ID=MMETSP0324_2-20121206/7045_1 /ASSEMBLY_ACC=CAM_ASM_000836 /TAXON_ID=2866 /ORGANISM="Crypthecodinium cohnii, Strain Seligo" /LENGTH=75 /DNA_ID=CAMNT_0053896727 /DNA_START=60 /DNA_END=287 /DNA_ORIENTATION=-